MKPSELIGRRRGALAILLLLNEHGECRIVDLGRRFKGASYTTLLRRLQELCEAALVKRTADFDKPGIYYHNTEEGRKVAEEWGKLTLEEAVKRIPTFKL